MQWLGMILFLGILVACVWYFCRSVDAGSRNDGGLHGGGGDGISDGVDMAD